MQLRKQNSYINVHVIITVQQIIRILLTMAMDVYTINIIDNTIVNIAY